MSIEKNDEGLETRLRSLTAIEPEADSAIMMYRCGWEAAIASQASRFSWKTFANGTVLGVAASFCMMFFLQRGADDTNSPIAIVPKSGVVDAASTEPNVPDQRPTQPIFETHLISRWLPKETKSSITTPTRTDNGLSGAAEIAWGDIISDNRAPIYRSSSNGDSISKISNEKWLKAIRNASPEELTKLLIN